MKKYEWILLDADNTLLDFDQAERLALRQTIIDAGIEYKEVHHQIYHRINKKCWEDFEQGLIQQDELKHMRFRLFFQTIGTRKNPIKANKNYLQKLSESDHMIPGAKALLEQLKEYGFKLALITNGLKEVQRPRILKTKLAPYFQSIIISDEIGVAKPHAGFFNYAYQSIQHPAKSSILVVGDSLSSDIKGGNNFGVSTCWYNHHGIKNETGILPKYTIDKIEELPSIIWRKP